MNLFELISLGNKRKAKRLGRGYSSGKGGHTVGRGAKGQKARSKPSLGFEGGQVPLYKRLPHIGGFRNPREKIVSTINLEDLNSFKDGDKITPEKLLDTGIIRTIPKYGVKILVRGELKKKLTLSGFQFSRKAEELIEKAGSKIEK